MSYFLTLISSQKNKPLSIVHLEKMEGLLDELGISFNKAKWLTPHKAADIGIDNLPTTEQMQSIRHHLQNDKIDALATAAENREKKLLIADMDSTIVQEETLDELAAHSGIKDQIAAITARAMNGEINFKQALRERVGLLKDLPVSALQETLDKTNLMPGAIEFVQTMKQNGAHCILVSGGFLFFTSAIAKMTGFDENFGNNLIIENDRLTGSVAEPILDGDSKERILREKLNELDLKPNDVLAIGDGNNDRHMIALAGLGIGYYPKPVLAKTTINHIIHGDLTAALHAQGFEI